MIKFEEAIKEVPRQIKRWFSSDNALDAVEKLNEKLELSGEDERIIPFLIMRLETKDISPRNFINELADFLGTSAESSKDIAGEIKDKILKPIQKDLYDWGVDIDLIKPEANIVELRYKPGTTPVGGQAKSEARTKEQEIEEPRIEKLEIKPQEPATAPFVINLSESKLPETKKLEIEKPSEPPLTTPFILRTEEELKPIAESVKPRISIPISAPKKKEAVPFRVELKEEDDRKKEIAIGKTAPPKERMVHYVGPKTSLFPQAVPTKIETKKPEIEKPVKQSVEEVIDLSSFREVRKPKPAAEQGPNVRGNTVDLR